MLALLRVQSCGKQFLFVQGLALVCGLKWAWKGSLKEVEVIWFMILLATWVKQQLSPQ